MNANAASTMFPANCLRADPNASLACFVCVQVEADFASALPHDHVPCRVVTDLTTRPCRPAMLGRAKWCRKGPGQTRAGFQTRGCE